MINKTKFDIIVPCYNVDHIIEKSLGSIFHRIILKISFQLSQLMMDLRIAHYDV